MVRLAVRVASRLRSDVRSECSDVSRPRPSAWRRRAHTLCSWGCLLGVALPARAQDATADQESLLQGSGVNLRGYQIQPSVGADVGYDSNYFQGSGLNGVALVDPAYRPLGPNVPALDAALFREPVVGAFRFRVTPAIALKPTAERRQSQEARIDVRAGLSASYNELFSTVASYADEVSAQRYLSGEASVALDFLPGRVWSGTTGLDYQRTVQPINDPTAPPAFRVSNVGFNAGLGWRPGGGLLTWQLGYKLSYVYFEQRLYAGYDNVRHDVSLLGQWRFLPRTTLYYQGGVGVLDFPDSIGVTSPGTPIYSKIGLNGLITRTLRVRTEAGYKVLFFDRGPETDTVVGTVELQYSPRQQADAAGPTAATAASAVSIGYERDALPSFLGNYVVTDRGFLRGMTALANTVVLRGEASFDHYARPQALFSSGAQQTPSFTENRLRLNLEAEYRATDSFGIKASATYTSALTDRKVPLALDIYQVQGRQTLAYDDLGFNRVEGWLGVHWAL
jgi:hypothetical protein